jgi:hypothetical protein
MVMTVALKKQPVPFAPAAPIPVTPEKGAEYRDALLALYFIADAMAVNIPQITAPWHKQLVDALNQSHVAVWGNPRGEVKRRKL